MSDEEQVETIARVCHEANCGLQDAQRAPGIPVAKRWDDFANAYPDQADGIREGVRKALAGATPLELHRSWCEAKLNAGWRHGDVKDPVAKTHPCLLPYAQLPVEQQRKDVLFHAIVGALAWMGKVRGCSRCGGDHNEIQWKRFERPIVDDDGTTWTCWAPCPSNGDPILMRDTDEVG